MNISISSVFVPLTPLPLIYDLISQEESYVPNPRAQRIKDKQGNLLTPKPTSSDNHEGEQFDIAPMAKRVVEEGNVEKLLYVDFTIDGTSNNLYFYTTREMGNNMQLGDFSPISGPVKTVNTQFSTSPDIVSVQPILENRILGIEPAISFEINSYPIVQYVKRISIYRTLDSKKANSVRLMDLAKQVTLDEEMLSKDIWSLEDDFEELSEIPYGVPIYYRIVVGREIEYAGKSGNLVKEYADSKPSKLIVSTIVETQKPQAPILLYSPNVPNPPTILNDVAISWEGTVYTGFYHLYKMNAQGNWVEIHKIEGGKGQKEVSLSDTSLGSGSLTISDGGNNLYHHFKVVAENSAGLFSDSENVLTIGR